VSGGILDDLRRREDGVYAVLFALLLTVFVGVVAIVIDIGLLRHDRRTDKLASDAAAIAGATRLGQSLQPDPQAACKAAVSYILQNLGSPSGTIDCGSFPVPGGSGYSSCPTTAATASGTLTGNGGTYAVTITWPVFDSDPLMAPDIRPASSSLTQPVVPDDGTPCSRLGVTVQHSRAMLFAGVFGDSTSDTANHSVSRTRIGFGNGGIAAPLVVLDPTSCNALTAEGGGGVQIIANGDVPGLIAVNSDGTGSNCNGGATAINSNSISGSNSQIWSWDSATSKAAILSYAITAGNAGKSFNPAQVTCPASNPPSGPLCPGPTGLSGQISRLYFIDNQYNCTVAGAGGCPASDPSAAISQLRSFVRSGFSASGATAPAGFYVVQGNECTNPQATYPGNVYVDCTANNGGFTVENNKTVDFTGGIVVFAGDVKVKASGCLLFNTPAADVTTACTTTNASTARAQDGPVVFLAGQLDVSSTNSSFIAPQTFVMQGDCTFDGTSCSTTPANVNLQTSGTGNIVWSAPLGPKASCTSGSSSAAPSPACFANLALWNEYLTTSSTPDTVSGQAALFLQGTFFTPNAQFVLSGGSGTNIRSAQFVTGRLDVHGGALLTMMPDAAHTNPPPLLTAALIR
jgi:Flp pilus assembly protein TadG